MAYYLIYHVGTFHLLNLKNDKKYNVSNFNVFNIL